MSTKKAMIERVASAFLKVSSNKDWFEGTDYIASYERDRWSEELTIFSPTVNIGRRGKLVEVREYRFENAGTSLPVYTIFHDEPTDLAALTRLLEDLQVEWSSAGRRVDVFSRNLKGVDKGLPVPQRIKMPDIEGVDITVRMGSNPIRVFSTTSSEIVSGSREIITGEIPWKHRAQVNALRGQIEIIEGLYALEKFLHANGIPMRVDRRMDPQYI